MLVESSEQVRPPLPNAANREGWNATETRCRAATRKGAATAPAPGCRRCSPGGTVDTCAECAVRRRHLLAAADLGGRTPPADRPGRDGCTAPLEQQRSGGGVCTSCAGSLGSRWSAPGWEGRWFACGEGCCTQCARCTLASAACGCGQEEELLPPGPDR